MKLTTWIHLICFILTAVSSTTEDGGGYDPYNPNPYSPPPPTLIAAGKCPFAHLDCPIKPKCVYPQVDRFAERVYNGQSFSDTQLSFDQYAYSVCDIRQDCFNKAASGGNYDCKSACSLYRHIFLPKDSTYTPQNNCNCPPSTPGCKISDCLQLTSKKTKNYYYLRKGRTDYLKGYLHTLLIPGYAIRGLDDIFDPSSTKWENVRDLFSIGWNYIKAVGFPLKAGVKIISEDKMGMVMNAAIYRSEHQMHIHVGKLNANFVTACLSSHLASAKKGWNSKFLCSGVFGTVPTFFPKHNLNVQLKAFVCDSTDITNCNFIEELHKAPLVGGDWSGNRYQTGAVVVKQKTSLGPSYVLMLIKAGPGYKVNEGTSANQCANECLDCTFPLQVGATSTCKNKFGDHQVLIDMAT